MDSFYITLPSNDPSYEHNKTSHFTVRLPETLELDNSWTVSLSSIIYPISFATLGAEEEQYAIVNYLDSKDQQKSEKIPIPSLNFHTIKEMEQNINAIFLQYFTTRSIQKGTPFLATQPSRMKRMAAADTQLNPVQENPEIAAKLAQLKRAKQQQQQQQQRGREQQQQKPGKEQQKLTPVSESAETQAQVEQLQMGSAKRAAERAEQEAGQNLQKTLANIQSATSSLDSIQSNKLAKIDSAQLNSKITKIGEELEKLRTISQALKTNHDDATKAKQETFGAANLSAARRAADNAKKTQNESRQNFVKANSLFAQLDALNRQANSMLESMPPKPQPVAVEQIAGDKKLQRVEEDQTTKDKLHELKSKKQLQPSASEQQKAPEKQLTKTEEDESTREKVAQLQRQKQLIKLTAGEPEKILPVALAQTKPKIEEEQFSDIVQKFHKDLNAKVIFKYDETMQKFIAFFDDTIEHVELSPELAYALGYSNQLFVMRGHYAQFMPTLSGGIKQLYVYSPIVEQSIVGNQKAPLLRVVNVIGEPGQIQEAIYSSEYHYRLQNKRISEITIEIRSATGRLVKFVWGNTLVTLHFKRSLFM